jgi:hypothetical protein
MAKVLIWQDGQEIEIDAADRQTPYGVPLQLLTQVKRRPDKDAGYATGLNRAAMKSRGAPMSLGGTPTTCPFRIIAIAS